MVRTSRPGSRRNRNVGTRPGGRRVQRAVPAGGLNGQRGKKGVLLAGAFQRREKGVLQCEGICLSVCGKGENGAVRKIGEGKSVFIGPEDKTVRLTDVRHTGAVVPPGKNVADAQNGVQRGGGAAVPQDFVGGRGGHPQPPEEPEGIPPGKGAVMAQGGQTADKPVVWVSGVPVLHAVEIVGGKRIPARCGEGGKQRGLLLLPLPDIR